VYLIQIAKQFVAHAAEMTFKGQSRSSAVSVSFLLDHLVFLSQTRKVCYT